MANVTVDLRSRMTYCDIAPSRVIGQSVCDVISQTFGQIIHEFSPLNTKQENYSLHLTKTQTKIFCSP